MHHEVYDSRGDLAIACIQCWDVPHHQADSESTASFDIFPYHLQQAGSIQSQPS